MGAQMGQSWDLQCPAGLGGMELSRGRLVCKYLLSQTRNSVRSRSQSTYKHPAPPSTSPCSSEAGWVQQCPLVLVITLNISSMVLPASSFRLALFLNSSAVNCPPPPFFFFSYNKQNPGLTTATWPWEARSLILGLWSFRALALLWFCSNLF